MRSRTPGRYLLLRLTGRFLTVFSLILLLLIVPGYLLSIWQFGLQPLEPRWAWPIFGVAAGEICRAVADLADRFTVESS